MSTEQVSLASLMTPSKTVSVDFADYEGAKIDLCYLSREEMVKLRKASISTKYNKKTHQPEEQLDENKFMKTYCKAVIKGWSGFKYDFVQELVLIDLGDINPQDEMAFNEDNAFILMKNSEFFDSWVTETAMDLGNFTGDK